ncbi:MAG: hypothetical protein ABS898_04790, partial [Psychrobacillus sp.]
MFDKIVIKYINKKGMINIANLIDYKIVNQRAKKYFKFLDVKREVNEINKARLGFYLFALE